MNRAARNRERVLAYVRRHFQRTDEWPTVRLVCRALTLNQPEVEAACEEGLPLMLTAFHSSPPEPLGSHFVEVCE